MEKQSEIVNRAADKLQTAQVRESQTEQGFVRVDIHRLDKLMNLVGELVIDRTRLLLLNNLLSSKYEKDGDIDALQEIGTRLARITMELQEEIMKTRMVTVRQVFRSFPPVVRVLAQGCGKEIELVMEGEDTELDRTIVEVLHDPLAHLISNGVEQGIESPEERIKAGKPAVGKIFLRAKHQGNYVIIEVEDDGRGIDYDQAGNHVNFTGRDSVMDKVRKSIEDVNGTVQVSAVPGKGTKCTVRLPLTLAVISALLVKCCGETYAIPLAQIREVLLVEKGQIDTIQEKEAILVRGEMLPLARLSGLLYDISDSRDKKEEYTVVVNLPEGAVGLIVDELIGEQEIVVKGLGPYLGKLPGFSGASILGDGRVTLILDVKGLVDNYSQTCQGTVL
ncbi:MAG: chemotaxis protein CheA [Bacillota bacterium]|nr:hypothetical protein [Clostridia bacterium]